MAQQRPQKLIPLFGGNPCGTSGTITSPIIDFNDIDIDDYQGYMALLYRTVGTFGFGGTNYYGTAGVTTFTYQVSSLMAGPFFTPTMAQPIGTGGTAGTSMDLCPMQWGTSGFYAPVPPFPFMKILCICGAAGTSGVYADLIVR